MLYFSTLMLILLLSEECTHINTHAVSEERRMFAQIQVGPVFLLWILCPKNRWFCTPDLTIFSLVQSAALFFFFSYPAVSSVIFHPLCVTRFVMGLTIEWELRETKNLAVRPVNGWVASLINIWADSIFLFCLYSEIWKQQPVLI